MKIITATPCGKRANGDPLPPQEYRIVREPEPFGEGKSRIWGVDDGSKRFGLDRTCPLAVVWTASITEKKEA